MNDFFSTLATHHNFSAGNSNLANGSGSPSQAASVGLESNFSPFPKGGDQEGVPIRGILKFSAETTILINNCTAVKKYQKPNGKPNIRKIADDLALNYTDLYRYLNNFYKQPEATRADKGKSRKLAALGTNKQKSIRNTFEYLLLHDAQGKVALAIEKTEMNTGVKIPNQQAYTWANAFKGTHEQHHYFQRSNSSNTPHITRDLWMDNKNLLSCVVADEWKVDEYGVWIHWNDPEFETSRAVAYIVLFQDMKTRYPLSVVVTPHSTTTADTIKGAMHLVRDYGRPEKWLFENGKTWKSDNFLRFIHGLYEGEQRVGDGVNVQFADYDQLMTLELHNRDSVGGVIRAGVKHPETKPVERTFRILKDEFCAFSPSYSPNMVDSRKPTLYHNAPDITKTFEQLRDDLTSFIYTDFLLRKRSMFHNRMLSSVHPENLTRPTTIKEAFDIAYANYTPNKIDEFRLAYLYGEKYKVKFRGGMCQFIYPLSLEKHFYMPEDLGAAYQFVDQKIVVLVNQYNVYTGWFFTTDGQLICACKDQRLLGVMPKTRANEVGKIRRKINTLNRQKVAALEEHAKLNGTKIFQYEKTLPEAVEGDESSTVVTAGGDVIDLNSGEIFSKRVSISLEDFEDEDYEDLKQ